MVCSVREGVLNLSADEAVPFPEFVSENLAIALFTATNPHILLRA